MGFDVSRFVGKVYDEVICPICLGVLEDPYEVQTCGHLFCQRCIVKWIETPLFGPPTCPIDRQEISLMKLKPAPKFLNDFLTRMTVKCDFHGEGCAVQMRLEDAGHHRANCPLNPNRPVECFRGCGIKLPPKLMLYHRCSLDPCQDAMIWSQIIENAKIHVRQRSYERHMQKPGLASAIKDFFQQFNKWLADPRILSQINNQQHQQLPAAN